MSFLAGDLGGTKTLLALFDDEGRRRHERRFESAAYPGLEAMVTEFLREAAAEAAGRPERAAFGVAGPVTEISAERQQARITNLSWGTDTDVVRQITGVPRVRLVNDFYAVAAACAFYAGRGGEEGLVALNPGARPRARGAVAVLGAGTGLGEALIAFPEPRPGEAMRAVILPSEGGHTDFAPRDDVEIALLRFLQQRHGGHVSYERVLCGAGLFSLYEFFRHQRGSEYESPAVRAEIDRDLAQAPAVVSRHGLAGTDRLCSEALDRFISLYGAEAGNLALKALATGGVYVAGGIAPKILPRLQQGPFLESFLAKGRFAALLAQVPVYVLTDPDVGLVGAAEIARAL